MIWHKADTVDTLNFQQAASFFSAYMMKCRQPASLSAGNYEYKVMNYRFAAEFIYSPAKLGNVRQPNQCGRVHLCPPNHLLMATINCLPTDSASSNIAIIGNMCILYFQTKGALARDSRLMY